LHVVTAGWVRGTLARMTSPVLSADAPRRSRRSWTRAEQAAHLADFATSGLSATAFCRRLGIGRSTLTRWRQRAAASPSPARRRGRPATARRPASAGFATVALVPDGRDVPLAASAALSTRAQPGGLTLALRAPSGMVADVAGLDVASAAALLRAVLTPVTPTVPLDAATPA
jgi:transposase-like protein